MRKNDILDASLSDHFTCATPFLPFSVIEWRLNEREIEILQQNRIILLEILPDSFSYIRDVVAYKFESSWREAFSRKLKEFLDHSILVHLKWRTFWTKTSYFVYFIDILLVWKFQESCITQSDIMADSELSTFI